MNKQTGFTLIELMIVIAILGIIASVVAPLIANKGSIGGRASDQYLPPAHVVQPTGPAPTCVNGFLMRGSEPVVTSAGVAVKC